MTEPDLPERLSASQIDLVLRRAAEIDAEGDSLSVEEVRRIAAEAGIDPVATRTAILETLAEEDPASARVAPPTPEDSDTKGGLLSPRRILTGAAVGAALGLFSLAPSEAEAVTGVGGILYLLLRAVQSIRSGSQLDFQLQNFATWLGVVASVLLFGRSGWVEDVALGSFLLWVVISLLGGLLVRFGSRGRHSSEARSGVTSAPP